MFYLSMEMPLPKCTAHEGDAGEGISICVKVSTGCLAERRSTPAVLKCWEVHVYKLVVAQYEFFLKGDADI